MYLNLTFKISPVRAFTVVCLWLLVLASCDKKNDPPADPFDPSVAKKLKDQPYGTTALQKADIYLPANRSSATKTLVLIHGGFWTSGDKSDMDTLIPPIQSEDPTLAIVNINYKLADGAAANLHPAQMNDFHALLDYLDDNASTWHTGKSYAFTGVSSGGHLALLYSYAYDNEHRVKTVASVLGPTNFADTFYTNNTLFQQLATSLLGKTWKQDSALHVSVSPVSVIKAGAPPTFMAYGGADPIVPVSNPDSLKARLVALGIPYNYTLYPGETHEMSVTAIKDIIKKMAAFFKLYQ